MPLHFEELWEKCENFHQESEDKSSPTMILEELMMKVGLYKAIAAQTEIPAEEAAKIKTRTLGEILLTLTNLSLKDNINTYEALNSALQYRSVQHYSKKYQP
jgi:hypothetical protein